jgi:hypothetical protein
VVNVTTEGLLNLMNAPNAWCSEVNGNIYTFAAHVLQAAQALNVTIPGGKKYNIPSGNFPLATPSPAGLTPYTPVAIFGADDFNDTGVTIKDVFDVIVNNTREVSPTCKSLRYPVHLLIPPTHPQSSRYCLVIWVCRGEPVF